MSASDRHWKHGKKWQVDIWQIKSDSPDSSQIPQKSVNMRQSYLLTDDGGIFQLFF